MAKRNDWDVSLHNQVTGKMRNNELKFSPTVEAGET